jgi:hypothetical protein
MGKKITMKQKPATLFALVGIFIVMIALLTMQANQQVPTEIQPNINNTLEDNGVQLEYGLVFPSLQAEDVALVNILDPVLDSQVSVAQSPEGIWQVISDSNQPTNQDYANSLALTLEKIPFIARLSVSNRNQYGAFGLNDHDAILVVSAIMRDEILHTFMVGNPVSTDNTTRGFYTVVDDKEEVYIVPTEPISYLIQYLEAYENTQKLDN